MSTPPSDTNTPNEKALERFVGYRIRRAWLAVQADLGAALAPFDLRMITYTALALVGGNPGLRQAQLASLMDMERPNLVAIIDELQNRGLLTRDRSPNDGRAYALHLTPQGHDLRTRATRAVEQHEERLTDGLRDADRPLIDAALARIRRNAESR